VEKIVLPGVRICAESGRGAAAAPEGEATSRTPASKAENIGAGLITAPVLVREPTPAA
jgi:hypothetical protein